MSMAIGSRATDTVSNFFHMRWGIDHVKTAADGMRGVQGPGQLFAQLGVTPAQLQRLGVHHMTAKSFLTGSQSQNFRGLLNVGKQVSTSFTSSPAAKSVLTGFSSSMSALEAHFPRLSGGAKDAASACKSAVTGIGGRCGSLINSAKSSGFFGSLFKSVTGAFSGIAKAAGPILRPLQNLASSVTTALKSFGPIARILPFVNLIFVVTDTFKAVKTLLDPNKSWGEKLAALGKAALSIGAALPIPGASLLGGVRGAWAIGDAAGALMKR